jgi:hypothetical protein
MGEMTLSRAAVFARMLGALALAACGPSAIPLGGATPGEGVATVSETHGVVVDEDGHVEITRVDETPVPEGSKYSIAAGKHKVELVRNSPTKASSAETYFLKAGGKYVAWNGCATKTVEKDGAEEEKRVCDQQPQLLPAEALHCYQNDDRTSADCKAATDEWSESGADE